MKKQKITDFLLWLYYNKRNISVSEMDVKETVLIFFSDTSGKNKYCQCKNKRKAVNGIWIDWHCTTCLKPLKN